jgi:hypothetical protein
MANVKITALTNLASGDVAVDDVFIIDDVSVPESKKITVANLRAAVDTIATSNINTVSSNVDAVEARRVANVTIFTDEDTALQSRLTTNVTLFTNEDTALQSRLATNVTAFTNEDTALQARITANNTLLHSNDFVTFTRLQANIDLVQDNVASVTVGSAADTEARLNANLDIVQDNVTAVQSRLTTNVTAFTNEDTALQSRLATNVTAFTNEDTALQSRLTTNVTAFTNEDTALQARIAANTLVAASNDFVTYTQLNSNINVVQDNVASIIDGTTAFTGDVTIGDTTDDSAAGPEFILYRNSATPADGDYLGQIQFKGKQDAGGDEIYAKVTGKISDASAGTEDGLIETAIKGAGSFTIVSRQKSNELQLLNSVGLSVDGSSTFTNQVTMNDDLVIAGNLTVNGDTVTINSTNKEIDDTLIMLANGTTGVPSNDIGILFNRGNQGNAAFFYDESSVTFKISDTLDPSSNTSLSPVTSANLDVGILTASTLKYDGTDVGTSITDNVAAVETRRTANIAGAISTVLTSDLTASRALIAGTGGKIEVSDITSTELGYLDGMTQNINSNLVALAAGIAATASADFPTGDYGLLDASNTSTDSFGVAVGDLTTFDLKADPAGSLSTEDLGALT